MKTYTYSEARQQLARLLSQARAEGCVRIRRRDGQLFDLQPTRQERSPLDVPGVSADVTVSELARWRREGEDASAARGLRAAASARKKRGARPPSGRP